MPEVLVRVARTSHWDAILPVLPRLVQADVRVFASFSGVRAPKRAVAWLAHTMGLKDTPLDWTRALRGPRGRLILTSADDVTPELLDERVSFVALPRLPLPVTVFPPDPPEAVRIALQALSRTPAHALVEAGHPHRLPDLPERLHGLPHALTGLPALDGRGGLLDQKTAVLLLDDEVWTRRKPDRQKLDAAETRLVRALAPLLDTDLSVEIHVLRAPLESASCPALAEALQQIEVRARVSSGRVQLRRRPLWRALPSAVAVLATSKTAFASALACGVARVWCLDLASRPGRADDRFLAQTLHEADYAAWVAREGWREPQATSEAISDLAHELRDGDATQRVAQLVLAAVTR